MNRRFAFVLLLATLSGSALAYPDRGGYVDAYYVPTTTKDFTRPGQPERDFDGDGFGVHAVVPIGPMFVLTGEAQRTTFDDTDTDQFRVGGGVQSSPDIARLLAYAEYINIKLLDGSRANGFGLHLRGSFDVIPPLNLFAEIGYVNLSDDGENTDGPEFLLGGAFQFTPLIGAFVDYRISRFSSGNDSKTRFDDLRTGVRFYLTR